MHLSLCINIQILWLCSILFSFFYVHLKSGAQGLFYWENKSKFLISLSVFVEIGLTSSVK